MRLERLTLHNFRGFAHFEVDLHPQCTVLAGVNGCGKTSVLDALAVSIGSWFLGFDAVSPRPILTDDVRLTMRDDPEQPTLEPQYPTTVLCTGEVDDAPMGWSRSLNRPGGKTTTAESAELRKMATSYQASVKRTDQKYPQDLPVFAYYGAGRLWSQKRASAKKRDELGSRVDGYIDCLDPASNHKLFTAWMKGQEQAKIQRIAEFAAKSVRNGHPLFDADIYLPPALTLVQETAVKFIGNGARALVYDLTYKELRVRYEEPADSKPFRLLSDGYRNLVALAADLAWRCVRLNPHLGDLAIAQAQGVVLIDELELHLHPGWQFTVLPRLVEVFPSLQFVVTTHAPVVLSTAQPEWIRFLDADGTVSNVDVARGLDVNTILKRLMGVPNRPEDTREQLERLGQLIEAEELDAAKSAYAELATVLPDEDPIFAGLAWELRYLETALGSDGADAAD